MFGIGGVWRIRLSTKRKTICSNGAALNRQNLMRCLTSSSQANTI
ncbi:hypothetical protein SynBIOSU31_02634 [Synechococcus sp. BIOS-U3-1]|nr:hypothetical protein SynBIOSU31_02634 [Synechococcus sp. BIOS-U3-1]